jgi:hypothetical protein
VHQLALATNELHDTFDLSNVIRDVELDGASGLGVAPERLAGLSGQKL